MYEVHVVSPMGTWFPSHLHLEATKTGPCKIWGIAAAAAQLSRAELAIAHSVSLPDIKPVNLWSTEEYDMISSNLF